MYGFNPKYYNYDNRALNRYKCRFPMLRKGVRSVTFRIKKAIPVSHRYGFSKRIYGIIIRKKG